MSFLYKGMLFFSFMVEDKTAIGLSYVEFLVHIHRQIQIKMSWSIYASLAGLQAVMAHTYSLKWKREKWGCVLGNVLEESTPHHALFCCGSKAELEFWCNGLELNRCSCIYSCQWWLINKYRTYIYPSRFCWLFLAIFPILFCCHCLCTVILLKTHRNHKQQKDKNYRPIGCYSNRWPVILSYFILFFSISFVTVDCSRYSQQIFKSKSLKWNAKALTRSSSYYYCSEKIWDATFYRPGNCRCLQMLIQQLWATGSSRWLVLVTSNIKHM